MARKPRRLHDRAFKALSSTPDTPCRSSAPVSPAELAALQGPSLVRVTLSFLRAIADPRAELVAAPGGLAARSDVARAPGASARPRLLGPPGAVIVGP